MENCNEIGDEFSEIVSQEDWSMFYTAQKLEQDCTYQFRQAIVIRK